MRTRRQKIQLELALEPAAKCEARSAGDRGAEARVARAVPERPATGPGPSMETVVQPGNLKKALARVRRNQGAPGLDGMMVEELGAHLQDHQTGIWFRLPGNAYEMTLRRRGGSRSEGVGQIWPLGAPAMLDRPIRQAEGGADAADFAIICPLVRPGRLCIRFLSIGVPPRWSFAAIRLDRGLAPPSCWSCSAHGTPTKTPAHCGAGVNSASRLTRDRRRGGARGGESLLKPWARSPSRSRCATSPSLHRTRRRHGRS